MPTPLEISREQRAQVTDLVSHGSNPRLTFFCFVALSTFIAAFGLLMNSTAVVIGAMLVAPLMTPILGLALALVQGNPRLLGHAFRAEVIGVLVAIAASFLVGLSIPYFEPTTEMLTRSHPNLLDLLVALFAGAAGAWALVDEELSPALPGVAISTAIVPPLANAGLCLSLGAYRAATGSFLLFFTNFLCILLVSALIFGLAGMSRRTKEGRARRVVQRFGPAFLALIAVGLFLGNELLALVESRQFRNHAREVLSKELSDYRVTNLKELNYWEEDGSFQVLAHVHAPRMLTPVQVKAIEFALEEELAVPINLFLRTTLTRTISASGSIYQNFMGTLDGFAFAHEVTPESESLLKTEQVIREYLGNKLGQKLVELQSFPWLGRDFFLAEVTGLRHLRRTEVAELTELVRKALGDPSVDLGVLQGSIGVTTERGAVHPEFAMRRPRTEQEMMQHAAVIDLVSREIAGEGHRVLSTSTTVLEDGHHFLFDVAGPQSMGPEYVLGLQRRIREQLDLPAHLYMHLVRNSVVSGGGYTSRGELLTSMGERTREAYEVETQQVLKEWR